MAYCVPTQARYIPRNPNEEQNIASSIQVLRTSDNASFLATKIPSSVCKDPKSNTFTTRLADAILPSASVPLSRILNHPNIISLIDIVQNSQCPGDVSEAGPYGDITVWEDMNAGALSYLLPLANTYPALADTRSWRVLAAENFQRFSLPEGLVWHVLRSISRALLWLHHGIKLTRDLSVGGGDAEWQPQDPDWHAILIMDVSPGQIWFKHPRGGVTYGECKLGGFGRARVCGSVGARSALGEKDEGIPMVRQWFWAPEVYENIFSPTRASEIWSLGATLYCMMTGIPPPRCCDYDWTVSRMNDKGFSKGLRDLVALMLKHHPEDRPRAAEVVNRADDAFAQWRTTEEGSMYVDADDYLAERAASGPEREPTTFY